MLMLNWILCCHVQYCDFYLKLYFSFYEKLDFLIKFYKYVGGRTGREKLNPAGDWDGHKYALPLNFGDRGREGNEESGTEIG